MSKQFKTSFICANCDHIKGKATEPNLSIYCPKQKRMVEPYDTPCREYDYKSEYLFYSVTITLHKFEPV